MSGILATLFVIQVAVVSVLIWSLCNAAKRARRDYFAAKVMHAIYMRSGGSPSAGRGDHDGGLTYVAEGAYAMADAMLKARAA